MFLQKSFRKQSFISTAFAVLASITVVAGFVYATTSIGTNISVDGNLTISGTSATSTFSTGGLTVGTNQFVVQQTSGNLGIGTTSPSSKLDISNSDYSQLTIRSTAAGGHDAFEFLNAEGSAPLQIFTANSGGAFFYSYGSGTLQLGANKLGINYNIGTKLNAGEAALTVVNTGGSPILNVYHSGNSSSSPDLFIASSGNVGIGTNTPAQLLSVAGDAYIAGTGTTTLNLKTTTASKGTCIEMFDSGGSVNRLYVNPDHTLKVEAGMCK